MTGGGLRLRTCDLGKLGRLALDGGRRPSRQIVPATWVAEALSVHGRANPQQD
jgi:hypothetical protein